MRYGRLIMALPEEEVFSVDRILELAFARGLLPENDGDDLTVVRRRAYDALSKFAKKHLDTELDERVANRNQQFIPGWYGWRWKLALPEGFFEDPEELARLRAHEDSWLDNVLVGFTPPGVEAAVRRPVSPTPASEATRLERPCPEPSREEAPHPRTSRRRRGASSLVRFVPGLVCGLILFFHLPRLDNHKQLENARAAREKIAALLDAAPNAEEARMDIDQKLLEIEDRQWRVIFYRKILEMDRADRPILDGATVPIRYNGFQGPVP